MATKPTTTITWAEEVNYGSGPFVGSPTKLADPLGETEGSIPGEGVVAEFYNYNIHYLGEWSQWLLSGSSDSILEASIVERDGDGKSSIAAIEVGGTASSDVPVVVNPNTGGPGTIAMNVIHGDNNGIVINGVGEGIPLLAQGNSDTNPVIQVQQNGDAEGINVDIGFSDNTGMILTALGSGLGIDLNVNTGVGIDLDGGSGIGIDLNTTSGVCLDADNTGTTCISATTTNENGTAVFATIDNNASTINSNAVLAQNFGAGQGLLAQSTTGWGAQFSTSTNTKAAINIVPKSSAPGSVANGDIFYISALPYANLGFGRNSGVKSLVWGTDHGYAKGFNRIDGSKLIPSDIAENYVTDVSMTLSPVNYEAPTESGYLEITVEFAAQVEPGDASPILTTWQVVDVTAGSPVKTVNVVYNGNGVSTGYSYISSTFRVLVPSGGTRTYRLDFQAKNGQNYFVYDRVIKAIGMFPTAGG